MSVQITILEGTPTITVENAAELERALRDATNEAQAQGMLGGIIIEAANKNSMTVVVGSSETVVTFDYGHHDPPYYASKGLSNEDEPIMTCYLNFAHHTEFPRKNVIPLADGIKAVKEFLASGELPACITWEEV